MGRTGGGKTGGGPGTNQYGVKGTSQSSRQGTVVLDDLATDEQGTATPVRKRHRPLHAAPRRPTVAKRVAKGIWRFFVAVAVSVREVSKSTREAKKPKEPAPPKPKREKKVKDPSSRTPSRTLKVAKATVRGVGRCVSFVAKVAAQTVRTLRSRAEDLHRTTGGRW